MSFTGWSTANKVRLASGLITATPLTMACWVNPATIGIDQHLMGCYNSGVTGDLNQFSLGIGPSNKVQAKTGAGAATAFTESTAALTASAWHHACATFGSPTSRTAYLNGGNAATNTTSITPTGINRATIGNRDSSTNDRSPAAGTLIAEAAIWNVVLDAAEIAALGAGIPPSLIRPQSLVAYLPLIRNLIDNKGNAFAIVGALSAADHCRIYGAVA